MVVVSGIIVEREAVINDPMTDTNILDNKFKDFIMLNMFKGLKACTISYITCLLETKLI